MRVPWSEPSEGLYSFSALCAPAGLPDCQFHPQIRIDNYVPRIAQVAHWSLLGRDTVADDPVHAPRMDLIDRHRQVGFTQDVMLVQNIGDDHHYKEHFLPFHEAFLGFGNADRLTAHTPYLRPGHRVPPTNEYLDFVRAAAMSHPGAEWRLAGLRDDDGVGPPWRHS